MLKEHVRVVRRRLGYLRWRARTYFYSRATAKCYENPFQIYSIDPQSVEAALVFPGEPSPMEKIGEIRNGDWDLRRIPLEEFDQYQAFCQRFQQGRPWQDTAWYASLVKDVQAGNLHFSCTNQSQLDLHFKQTDLLFETIKTGGYKTQSQLNSGQISLKDQADEVIVCLDRHGRYLFGEGRHRFFISRVLGLKSIPVMVGRRHAQWVKFRLEVLDHISKEGGKAYQPLLHPDLADIPWEHGDERFEMMREALESRRGTLLDIGANWGYFSHRCEDLGYDCTAVESFPREAHFLRRLRDARNRKFKIIEKSVLDLPGPQRYDVVLALNIFHHFIKEEGLFKKLVDLLHRVETNMILFQPHLVSESQMVGAYKNFDQEEFAAFVAENAHMNNIRKCGTAPDGRNVYVISK